ncbi:MAG: TonB-dependent receptor [Bryobacter sp.]|nr:TonB-dependent receptor [Bryobacter sp.]
MKYLFPFLLLLASAAFAQTNATDATIDGYVTDPAGGAVPNAKVTVQALQTNLKQEAQTNEAGYYRFPLLQIGSYRLQVEATSFALYSREGLTLTVGRHARINVALQLASTSEKIEVSAEVPIVDIGTNGTGETVNANAVRGLPIPSRNIYNLHLIGPGIKGQPSSNFATTFFFTGGQNRTSWSVDGIDTTQRRFTRQIRMGVLTPEGVQEMQVLSGGYSAEFGRAAGSVISLITRSGTNDFHGGGMYLYRPNSWSARPPLAASRVDQSWWLGALNLGGPIVRDRAWFFLNNEYNPYEEPSPVTITPANATALGLSASDTAPSPYAEKYHNPSAKVNFQINSRNTAFLRYGRFANNQPIGRAGLTIPSRTTDYEDRQNTGAGQWTSILSPQFLSETRFSLNRRTEIRQPVNAPNANGAFINIQGVANIGANPLSGSSGTESAGTLNQSFTYTMGRHTLKAGLEYQTVLLDVTNALNRTFTFNGLAASGARPAVTPLNQYLLTVQGAIDPATNRPYTYTQLQQQIGDPSIALRFHFFNWFVQDEFRISPRLMLNFGLRQDTLHFPSLDPEAPYPLSRELNSSALNFAPRFGFSYQPFRDMRTVIRGSYGIFFDTPPLNLLSDGALNNGRRVITYAVPGTNAQAPRFPNLLDVDNPAFATRPSITAFTPDYRLMYGQNANLILEREILPNLSLALQYSFWGHRRGLSRRDINLGEPVRFLSDGRPVFRGTAGRPDTRFAAINLIEPGGTSNYHGLDITLRQRFRSGLQFSTTWSWSHAIGDSDLTGSAYSNPVDRRFDRGNLNGDLRHSVNFALLYAPQFQAAWLKWTRGFELSTLGFYNSGYPIDVRAGVDLNADLVLNDRNPGIGFNALNGPDLFQLDARIARKIRIREGHTLELLLESDNLTNRLNANCTAGCTNAVVNRDGAADFGRITSARIGRRVQFGVRYAF